MGKKEGMRLKESGQDGGGGVGSGVCLPFGLLCDYFLLHDHKWRRHSHLPPSCNWQVGGREKW